MNRNEKPRAVRLHDTKLDKEYVQWIYDIKQRFRNAQIKAAVKVNSEQLLFNWQLGRDLVVRKAEEKWGNGIVEQVSLDLQAAFPEAKGFSARNLWNMKKWYSFYTSYEDFGNAVNALSGQMDISSLKLQQVAAEIQETASEEKPQQVVAEIPFPALFGFIPWGHHIEIITKCKDLNEALFYVKRTIEEGWSRNALDNCLRADMYHAVGTAVTNFSEKLPTTQGELAQEILKSNYDLGFISLPPKYDENALEDVLEQRMTRFLLELGEGWAFVGRQKEIIISGKTRKIDLLFYHIYLRCYVVLELKVKPFDPEYAGKLNFYVNAVNEFIRKDSDNPTIGLLICKDMDRTEVQLAFQGITTPMGVATYDNVKIKEIQEYLPTAEQIQQQIKIAEEEYRISLSEKKDR